MNKNETERSGETSSDHEDRIKSGLVEIEQAEIDSGAELRKIVKVESNEADGKVERRNELMLANHRLSFQAHRLFLYVLSMVKVDHDEKTEYEFSVSKLADTIGIDRNHLYKSMVGVLDELAKTIVNVPVFDEKGKPTKDTFVRVGLIKNKQRIRMIDDGQQLLAGAISVSIHKELLPYVLDLKERFTTTELKYVFLLSSSFAQRLYDLLKMRAFMGRPWKVPRQELRDLLVIEPGTFTLWGDFRRFVLERAQREICTHTDLAFDIEYLNVGRTVTDVVFRLRKEGGHQVDVMPGTSKYEVFKLILDLGVSAPEAERVLLQWWDVDPERIRWHVSEAKRQKTAGKIKSIVGWFLAGMKQDYRPGRPLFGKPRPRDVKAPRSLVTDRDLRKEISDLTRQWAAGDEIVGANGG